MGFVVEKHGRKVTNMTRGDVVIDGVLYSCIPLHFIFTSFYHDDGGIYSYFYVVCLHLIFSSDSSYLLEYDWGFRPFWGDTLDLMNIEMCTGLH